MRVEDEERLRGDARQDPRAGPRRRGGRAADRPPGRPRGPRGLSAPAERGDGRPLDGRREDPHRRRAAAGGVGRSRGRPATTRCGTSTACSPTRPGVDQLRSHVPASSRVWRTTWAGRWEPTVRRAAYRVLTHELVAETEHLVRLAERICAAGGPELRDHAPWALRLALRELLVRVPVYRPYRLGAEAGAARAGRPGGEGGLPGGRGVGRGGRGAGPGARPCSATARSGTAFRARFAQTSSALHAKSVEDTAFYRYTPLLSVNEVGGDPGRPSVEPGRVPRVLRPPRPRLAGHRHRPVHARHQAQRGGAGPDRGAFRVPAAVGGAARTGSRGRGRPTRTSPGWRGRRRSGSAGLPEPERLDGGAAEGGARGRSAHELDGTGPGYEKAVSDFVAAGPGRRTSPRGTGVRARRPRTPRGPTAWAPRCCI